ncbi:Crp/Fnr family transcriptional regulator [Flavivirga aquimarina]|uniref:Crp/Fnr family transcriptional regulator n=1 Tax=Flavivirga aquimarina TaxID=2027862 RepID=A0ABT8WB07_9FLAO|nr:Crp/Fnr family transcriptional regulator [Flavivirga aquimarina]MDO5970333.1 Crp/Fnr family transcriptional regulator [Flavivirga aquimarina]
MNNVRAYFDTLVKMNDVDWELFSSKLEKKEFKKRTILLESGNIEKYLYFIEKGSVRLYIPKEDYDLTFGFCFSGRFMSAYDSFLTQTSSTYHIETLTETTIWRLTFDDLQDIYKQTEVGHAIGRIAAENLFLAKVKREQSLLNQTPQERYLSLFTEQPQLIKEIPLKYLASYIGITPQALSRIRKRIS